jgi:cyclophilin family peptidyl-prolyl cis-trans isomerase
MKLFFYYILLIILFIFVTSCGEKTAEKIKITDISINQQSDSNSSKDTIDLKGELSKQDSIKITHKVLLKTTMGNILIGLYGEDAPKTVENFIGLVKKGYYNGILIHRVAKNFLIQTGDRNTRYPRKRDEWGQGGQSIFGEPFEDELSPETLSYQIGYQPGVVAMANRGPNTNTSQFFICLDEARDLDKHWTIFGRVLEGMDVVQKINEVDIVPGPFEPNDGIPVEPVRIIRTKLQK